MHSLAGVAPVASRCPMKVRLCLLFRRLYQQSWEDYHEDWHGKPENLPLTCHWRDLCQTLWCPNECLVGSLLLSSCQIQPTMKREGSRKRLGVLAIWRQMMEKLLPKFGLRGRNQDILDKVIAADAELAKYVCQMKKDQGTTNSISI